MYIYTFFKPAYKLYTLTVLYTQTNEKNTTTNNAITKKKDKIKLNIRSK